MDKWKINPEWERAPFDIVYAYKGSKPIDLQLEELRLLRNPKKPNPKELDKLFDKAWGEIVDESLGLPQTKKPSNPTN